MFLFGFSGAVCEELVQLAQPRVEGVLLFGSQVLAQGTGHLFAVLELIAGVYPAFARHFNEDVPVIGRIHLSFDQTMFLQLFDGHGSRRPGYLEIVRNTADIRPVLETHDKSYSVPVTECEIAAAVLSLGLFSQEHSVILLIRSNDNAGVLSSESECIGHSILKGFGSDR